MTGLLAASRLCGLLVGLPGNDPGTSCLSSRHSTFELKTQPTESNRVPALSTLPHQRSTIEL